MQRKGRTPLRSLLRHSWPRLNHLGILSEAKRKRNTTRNNKRNRRRWRLIGSLLCHSWALMTTSWGHFGLSDLVFPESAWRAFGEHVGEKEE